MKTLCSIALLISTLCVSQVQGIYFYLERDMMRCFKDEIVKNFVSEIKLLSANHFVRY